MDGLLHQGLSTPNHFLYHIVLGEGAANSRIGYLWIEVDEQKRRCFIADIYLFPEYQKQGWGRKTLELLDLKMKEADINRINLHVFANNQVALNLYTSMGYQTIDMTMQKWLAEEKQ